MQYVIIMIRTYGSAIVRRNYDYKTLTFFLLTTVTTVATHMHTLCITNVSRKISFAYINYEVCIIYSLCGV